MYEALNVATYLGIVLCSEKLAMLVSRLTVARTDLSLRLNTTQGVGVGSRTADGQYIAHKYISLTTMVSVTNCSKLSYHTQSQIH